MRFARWGRRGLVALGLLLVLILAAALLLPHLVDANRYRALLAEKLGQASGRKVALGSISFGLLPAPAIAVAPITVSEAAPHQEREALRAEALSVRLGLAGLLRGRVTFTSILLKRPVLTLIRDARGHWNFDDLLARVRARSASVAATRGPAPVDAGSPTLSIDRAIIRSGRVLVDDDAVIPGRRSEVVLSPIDATVSGWGSGTETRFDLLVGLGRSVLRSSARLSSDTGEALQGELDGRSLEAADLARLLPWLGVARPAGLEVGGAIVLAGSAVLPLDRPEAVRFRGTLRFSGLSYRDAGMARPVKDLSGTLAINGDRATWDDFSVSIGTSSLRGELSIEKFLRPAVGFSLSSPRLDLNEILGTFSSSGEAPPGSASGPAAGAAAPPPGESAGGIFADVLARGTLAVRAIRFQTLDLSDVRATMALERRIFSLRDLRAGFYGGALAGSAVVDLAQPVPRYSFGVKMEKVDVEPLLAAYDPGLKGLLSGRLAGDLELSSSGDTMQEILGSAKGTGALDVTEGSITSFSVLRQIAALLELAGGKGIGRDTTPFHAIGAHLQIAGGRAATEDLFLHSTDLDLAGEGWVGLDATMSLDLTTRFSADASQGMVEKTPRLGVLRDRDRRLTVRFSLDGSLKSPGFRLDTAAQLRDVRERKKEEARQRILEHLEDRLRKSLGGEVPPSQ